MTQQRFCLTDYLAPGDAYHVVRKRLGPGHPAPWHVHDYHELFLVEEGLCRHRTGSGTGAEAGAERLAPGSLVFVRPEDAHALSGAAREGCRIVNLMFRSATAAHLAARYGDDLSGRFFWAERPGPLVLPLSPDRREQTLAMLLGLMTGPRSLARIEAFLLALMTGLTDLPARAEAAMPGWLAQACDAARRPEVYRRGAAGLVEAAGRGHEHVCRRMKAHLGLTPSAYVNRIRMDRAAALLARGEAPLADIAAEVGLENLSHFHRLFRAHHGLTPRAYRARHRDAPF